jgi:ABC-type branched-subunit amino acid transport system substrate-binding protein
MRSVRLLSAICWWIAGAVCVAPAQDATAPASAGGNHPACECGAHPPRAPRDREVVPYAGEPRDLSPYAKFAAPYDLNYTHPNIYMGAGRDIPEPKGLTEVRIGFIGPIEHNPDQVAGLRMLHGAQLAVEEANARGGYGGIPFRLMLHNDYDNWQANSVYGDDRPTDPTIWGSASNETVKMVYDDQDWAIFGSISSEATHIVLRVALKAEIPVVNSASTDPTIPETYIPWYFTDLQDDRVQSYTLARRIFSELGLKRVAILRVNNRYGRFGVPKFRDASRRLGHPVVIEQKFLPGDTDFSRQLRVIQDSRADAILLWTDQAPAARILKQMRELGMKQRVFGSYRTLGPELLAAAGPAAEGFEAVFPYDPTRNDPAWTGFQQRYRSRFNEPPEQFASLAFDAMNALLQSICKAGLNRARIHDALAGIEEYDGVTGHMVFDPNLKNVAPMYLGAVHNGSISYRRASMEKQPEERQPAPRAAQDPPQRPQPYASLTEEAPHHAEPHSAAHAAGPHRVVLFGPGAEQLARLLNSPTSVQTAAGDEPLTVLPIESKQNWGAAATQLVHALMDEHAIGMIALDAESGHLAAQMSLKCFVPVVALSDDKSLTSANVPWVFRLPAGTAPASAFTLFSQALERGGEDPWKIRDLLASGNRVGGFSFLATGDARP